MYDVSTVFRDYNQKHILIGITHRWWLRRSDFSNKHKSWIHTGIFITWNWSSFCQAHHTIIAPDTTVRVSFVLWLLWTFATTSNSIVIIGHFNLISMLMNQKTETTFYEPHFCFYFDNWLGFLDIFHAHSIFAKTNTLFKVWKWNHEWLTHSYNESFRYPICNNVKTKTKPDPNLTLKPFMLTVGFSVNFSFPLAI